MNEELKKELDLLRADLAKNADALARITVLEAAIKKGEADVKSARDAMDELRRFDQERKDAITELRQKARTEMLAAGPQMARTQAVEMLGMLVRRDLCRRIGQAVPELFKHEDALVRTYETDTLARATLSFAATPGSYLVPTVLEQAYIDTLAQVSPLMNEFDFVPGLPMAGTINIPTITGRPVLQHARANSDTKMTQSDATFGKVTLTPQEAYIYFPVDNNLLMMSALALGTILIDLLNQAVVQGLVNDALNADGTAAFNLIMGLLNETTADYIYTLPAGKVAFGDLTAKDLRAAKQKVQWQYWQRGKWLMNLDVQGIVEDLDRLGKVPVGRDMPDGSFAILRNQVVTEALMPTTAVSAPNSPFAMFGDLKAMLVGMAGGIRIASSTDYLFGNNQTAFRATMLMDMKRKPMKSLVLLKTAEQAQQGG